MNHLEHKFGKILHLGKNLLCIPMQTLQFQQEHVGSGEKLEPLALADEEDTKEVRIQDWINRSIALKSKT